MADIAVRLTPEDVDRIAAQLAERLGAGSYRPEPWVDVAAAAAHLACRPQRIYDLVSQGSLPHRKDGRRVLFRLSELDSWLDGPSGQA